MRILTQFKSRKYTQFLIHSVESKVRVPHKFSTTHTSNKHLIINGYIYFQLLIYLILDHYLIMMDCGSSIICVAGYDLLWFLCKIIMMNHTCQWFLNETNPKLICSLQSRCNCLCIINLPWKYSSVPFLSTNKSVLHSSLPKKNNRV